MPAYPKGWLVLAKIQEGYNPSLFAFFQGRGIGYASLTADAAIPLAVWWSCEKT